MAVNYVKGRQKQRVLTTAEWESGWYPVLLYGEIGIEICEDGSRRAKIGDGSTSWNNLPYLSLPNNVTVSINDPTGSEIWIEVPFENVAISTSSPTGTDMFVIELQN